MTVRAGDERDPAGREGGPETPPSAESEPPSPTAAPLSPSVEALLRRFAGATPTAGELVSDLLSTHGRAGSDPYLDPSAAHTLRGVDLSPRGPARTADDHLAAVRTRWGPEVRLLTGRHVVLGLAPDEIGPALLDSGVVAAMLTRWQPGKPPDEPPRVVWDALSDEGRSAAEDQPLLATAFGAPPEGEIQVPDPVRALAWSPRGDRIAVLTGDEVLVVAPDSADVRRLGPAPLGTRSIGWGSSGVTVLAVHDGEARVTRVPDGDVRGPVEARDGLLSGDASAAWLAGGPGVVRWSPATGDVQRVTGEGQPDGLPVAVDHPGERGLLSVGGRVPLVTTAGPPGSLPVTAPWPSDAAPLLGWGPARASRWALPAPEPLRCVAMTPDGLELRMITGDVASAEDLEGLLLCRVATGRVEVTALAVDATGDRLAAAVGTQVRTWSLAYRRRPSMRQPQFDNDRPDGEDLLDTGRDAETLAALIASADLHPPLSIGLFGDWGSGKSFVLSQLESALTRERPDGFLRHVRIVRFNAWQYVETNLWASLVHKVLADLGPVPAAAPSAAAGRAREQVITAENQANAERIEVAAARARVAAATSALARRRRRAGYLLAAVLLFVAAAAVAVHFGSTVDVAALWATVASLVAVAGAVVREAAQAQKSATEAAGALAAGFGAAGRLLGRPEAEALRARAVELADHERRHREAAADVERRQDEVAKAESLARDEPLRALLQDLAQGREYRDQLTMVTRVYEHLEAVDRVVRAEREGRSRAVAPGGAPAPGSGSEPLDRVVVVIDDLDRCPPDKVVGVLEAVHLLFGFGMYVVVIAVDTRWLEQSLRIRYRQLLGRADTAAPIDYMEKILQMPVQLAGLDGARARRLIAGLTGAAAPTEPETAAAAAQGEQQPVELHDDGTWLTSARTRTPPPALAADVLRVTSREAAAMSEVVDLFATTPRTVKRFVNTFRLVKAGSANPEQLDADRSGRLGDHEVVAFLLAVLVGAPNAATTVLPALWSAPPATTVAAAVAGAAASPPPDPLHMPGPLAAAELERRATQLAAVAAWLARRPRYADEPAGGLAGWIPEVARYSFVRIDLPELAPGGSAPGSP